MMKQTIFILMLIGGLAFAQYQPMPVSQYGNWTVGVSNGLSGLALESTASNTNSKLPSSLGTKSSANSFPVVLPSDQAALTVSGSVTANAGTNLNTSALNLESTQSAMSAKFPSTLGQKTASNSFSTVLASDQGAIPVTGTFYQATQPVSSTQLPTSLGQKTSALSFPTVIASDNIVSNRPTNRYVSNNYVSNDIPALNVDGMGTVTIRVTGTWTGTYTPEVSHDNSSWFNSFLLNKGSLDNNYPFTIGSNGDFSTDVSGYQYFRLNPGVGISSGTAVISMGASTGNTVLDGILAPVWVNQNTSPWDTRLTSAIPAGTNGIGKLTANSGVDIGDVTLTAGSASIGILGANSGVDIGDVTLTAGTAAFGKLAANSGVDIGDVTIDNASGAAAVNIQDGGNIITVDGAVTVTGTVTANAGTNLNTSLLSTSAKQDTQTTSLQLIDDTVVDNGVAASSRGINMAGNDGVTSYVLKTDNNGYLQTEVLSLPSPLGALSANSGVDIGDVTINNASGAAAVNIQDGGNAITVDNGGTFPVQAAATQSGNWSVRLQDGLGTNLTTTSANLDINLKSINGTAPTVGLGTSTAGTQRIIIASDQSTIPVQLVAPSAATYAVGTGTFSPPATPTDMCTITGSATKTVKVSKISFTSTQTTAGINTFFLVKRTTANSGGTSVASNVVSLDSSNAAVTAVVARYTANPTLGTLLGNISTVRALSPAPASVISNIEYLWDFGTGKYGQPIVLRGINNVVAVSFNAAALPTGLSMTCDFVWTEE